MRIYENIEYFVNRLHKGEYSYKDGVIFNELQGGREIKGTKYGKGSYKGFDTTLEGRRTKAFIHLVIFAYHYGMDELRKHETIDHIDGDKYNNRIENLQGMTRVDNSRKSSLGKLDVEKARYIKRRLTAGDTCTSLAEKFKVNRTAISNIKNGRTYKEV